MVNSLEVFQKKYVNRSEEIKDAIEYYEKSASKGHLDAITDLGHIFENGIKKEKIYIEQSLSSP